MVSLLKLARICRYGVLGFVILKEILGPVDIQPPLATLAHFRPLTARFFSSTSSTSRKIRLPEDKNVLRVPRKAEGQQTSEAFSAYGKALNEGALDGDGQILRVEVISGLGISEDDKP